MLSVEIDESVPWTTIATSTESNRRSLGMAFCADREHPKLFLVGGEAYTDTTSNLVQIIDLQTFESYPCNLELVVPRKNCAAVVAAEKLWVFGGYNGDNVDRRYEDSCEVLDLSRINDGFVLLETKMPHPMFNMVAWNHSNQEIYLIGGYNGQFSSAFWRFNVHTEQFQVLPPMQCRRNLPAVVQVGDSLLILGGREGRNQYSKSIDCFHLPSKKWGKSRMHDLPMAEPLYYGFLLKDRFLVLRYETAYATYCLEDQQWRVNCDGKQEESSSFSRWDRFLALPSMSCVICSRSSTKTVQHRDLEFKVIDLPDCQNVTFSTRADLDAKLEECHSTIQQAEEITSDTELLDRAIAAEALIPQLEGMKSTLPTLDELKTQKTLLGNSFTGMTLVQRREMAPKIKELEDKIQLEYEALSRTRQNKQDAFDDRKHAPSINRPDGPDGATLIMQQSPMAELSLRKGENHVFVSHTGQDEDARVFTAHLCDSLTMMNIGCFYDAWSIKVGSMWKAEIEKNVRDCTIFVCVLSQNYCRRYWCLHELDLAIQNDRVMVPVFYKCNPPEVTEELRDFLLEEHRDHQVTKERVERWCDNLRRLRAIQGIRNYSTAKDADVEMKRRTLRAVSELLGGVE